MKTENRYKNTIKHIKTKCCFFGIAILFSSCVTHKKLARSLPENVSAFSVDKFNGNYRNNNPRRNVYPECYDLWKALWAAHTIRSCKITAFNTTTHLTFDNNRLTVRLIEEGEIIREIVLKAKQKENYLSVKRKYFSTLLPFPFLYYSYNYKVILANTEDGNLIVKIHNEGYAGLLFFFGGDSYYTSAEFVKINNKE